MAISIQNTNQAIANNGVKMLVYGLSGVGKTTLAGTWIEEETLILSAEGGMMALSDKDIDVIEIRSVEALEEALEWVQGEAGDKYSLIVLDSISEMAEVCLKEEKAKGDLRRAYGELIEVITDLLRRFRDLERRHVLLIAKAERMRDEITGAVSTVPSAPGQKLSGKLPYLVDEVWAMRALTNAEGETERRLQTAPGDGYDGKDRSRQLGMWEIPNLTHIITKITGETNA